MTKNANGAVRHSTQNGGYLRLYAMRNVYTILMMNKRNKMYNGHKNYNHWNVALWLFNSEFSYNLMTYYVNQCRTLDDAARNLARYYAGGLTPDGAPYSFTSIRAAITNWEQ